MEPGALGWDALIKSWIAETPAVMDEWLKGYVYQSLFRRFCDPLIYWLRRSRAEVFVLYYVLQLFIMILTDRIVERRRKCVRCLTRISSVR